MKKTLVILLTLIVILGSIFCIPVSAASANVVTETTIEYLENGDYIETVLTYEESPARATNTSGSRTKTYKNSSGTTLWSVTVRCTFTYNGSVSACTSASYSTTCPGTYWSIKNASASRAGNTGTAYATATYSPPLASSQDYNMSVSLSCSTYGELY